MLLYTFFKFYFQIQGIIYEVDKFSIFILLFINLIKGSLLRIYSFSINTSFYTDKTDFTRRHLPINSKNNTLVKEIGLLLKTEFSNVQSKTHDICTFV